MTHLMQYIKNKKIEDNLKIEYNKKIRKRKKKPVKIPILPTSENILVKVLLTEGQ